MPSDRWDARGQGFWFGAGLQSLHCAGAKLQMEHADAGCSMDTCKTCGVSSFNAQDCRLLKHWFRVHLLPWEVTNCCPSTSLLCDRVTSLPKPSTPSKPQRLALGSTPQTHMPKVLRSQHNNSLCRLDPKLGINRPMHQPTHASTHQPTPSAPCSKLPFTCKRPLMYSSPAHPAMSILSGLESLRWCT